MNREMMGLSIIIVNWNTRELLAQCLQSIEDSVRETVYEVWVVDNGSSDSSVTMVAERFPAVHVIDNPRNVGFVCANNQALARCRGRYVLLLNSDTQALADSVDRAVRFISEHPRAGIAGVRLLNSDGTFQASYTPYPPLLREVLILSGLGRLLVGPAFPSREAEVEKGAQRITGYVEGAFLMARREAIEQIGGLDEHIFMYAEEVDWCYRFHQAGWEVWYLPRAPIIHHGGQTSKKRQGRMEAELYRSRIYFFRKHHGKAAALCLQLIICAITLPKMLIHWLLRYITRGRVGRTITSWQELRLALTSVDSASKEGVAL